ncbi:hypothetical protein ACIBG0_16195 [Nocardia sp. NPDC050630]|uniref:hypothetical protein n=1 Tax=Nocardia sp. NPDC050630 TaxID=3364321 RepID=UPI0037B98F21
MAKTTAERGERPVTTGRSPRAIGYRVCWADLGGPAHDPLLVVRYVRKAGIP